jgi:hypothetical protein
MTRPYVTWSEHEHTKLFSPRRKPKPSLLQKGGQVVVRPPLLVAGTHCCQAWSSSVSAFTHAEGQKYHPAVANVRLLMDCAIHEQISSEGYWLNFSSKELAYHLFLDNCIILKRDMDCSMNSTKIFRAHFGKHVSIHEFCRSYKCHIRGETEAPTSPYTT